MESGERRFETGDLRAESGERRSESRVGRDVVVSCVMPTRGRRAWVLLALRCWMEQDLPTYQRELVVIDDGPDQVADLLQHCPGVRYVYLDGEHSIGAKLNLGCEMARGDEMALWADDDWHAPGGLSYKLGALRAQGPGIRGGELIWCWAAGGGEAGGGAVVTG